jgi:hypothetical protein
MRMKRLSVVDFILSSYDVEVSMDVLFTNNINKNDNVDYCILYYSSSANTFPLVRFGFGFAQLPI